MCLQKPFDKAIVLPAYRHKINARFFLFEKKRQELTAPATSRHIFLNPSVPTSRTPFICFFRNKSGAVTRGNMIAIGRCGARNTIRGGGGVNNCGGGASNRHAPRLLPSIWAVVMWVGYTQVSFWKTIRYFSDKGCGGITLRLCSSHRRLFMVHKVHSL